MRAFRKQVPIGMGVALATTCSLLVCARLGWAEPSREARVEAAFIYNFTQFVEWPPEASAVGDSTFIVAVVGDDPLAGALEQATAGKTVKGRPIQVKHFAGPDQIGSCQL